MWPEALLMSPHPLHSILGALGVLGFGVQDSHVSPSGSLTPSGALHVWFHLSYPLGLWEPACL